jgi:alpha-D-xyloside xylohydrolase
MPFWYSLAGQVYINDYTIMRAMIMDFSSDKNTWDLKNQYMIGSGLLVAPVTYYKAKTREVYLPANTSWFDFYTGQQYEGGKTITANAPYERMPIYVKAGSIIPCGPELQHVFEQYADPITLYVFTGANGDFTLYEDDGQTYNYESGKNSTIDFKYNDSQKTLTIGKQNGSFEGMLKTRKFEIVMVDGKSGAGIMLQSKSNLVVEYDGTEQSVKLD